MKFNFPRIVIAGGLVGLTALTAFAGLYGYHSFKVTVQSSDWRWALLRVPTDRPIRLVKKLSKSPCDYGRTWGITSRGIWVDHGCRATFEIAGNRPQDWHTIYEDTRYPGDRDYRYRAWSSRDWDNWRQDR